MSRFDRRMIRLIIALSLLLLAVGLWATSNTKEGAMVKPGLLYLVSGPTEETYVWQWKAETSQKREIAKLPGFVQAQASVTKSGYAIYPVRRPDGGYDLWQVSVKHHRTELRLDCAPDNCIAVAPSPDDRGIIYTRVTKGQPTLWWLPDGSTETNPLFEADTLAGHYASWSPEGTELAYYDPAGQVCILDFSVLSKTLCVKALTDSPAVWSPDGSMLLITDGRLERGFASHILRLNVNSGEFIDLSTGFGVEDDAPAWSPDGEWIAFRRKTAGTAMGKQLWVMRADGNEARALTNDTASHYGPPIWSTDGKALLATRYREGTSGIWTISRASGSAKLFIPDGYSPNWLGP